MKNLLIVMFLLVLAPLAQALQSEAPPPPPMREPEPLPPKVQDSEDRIEPQVIIRREEDRSVEEYSSGGVVYMIRVIPDIGPPYFLIDTTGDGDFDSRFQHDQIDPVFPAHWKVWEW